MLLGGLSVNLNQLKIERTFAMSSISIILEIPESTMRQRPVYTDGLLIHRSS